MLVNGSYNVFLLKILEFLFPAYPPSCKILVAHLIESIPPAFGIHIICVSVLPIL